MSSWKIAGVQFDCKLQRPDQNLATMKQQIRNQAERGARLIVFPECALAGYCYGSKAEALPFAETLPGPSTDLLGKACAEMNCYTVFGLLEREGDRLFNSLALVGPQGFFGSYRKTHLPFLGVDRYVSPGDRPFQVIEIEDLRLGMLICFDGSFPEAPRILALLGADLIVLPTNWPEGAECSSAHIPEIRAHENHIYFMAVNRVGSEGGFRFIGRSRLVDWNGRTLAAAATEAEESFIGTIEPHQARAKRVVNKPGEYELDRIAGRRPDLYGRLLEGVEQ